MSYVPLEAIGPLVFPRTYYYYFDHTNSLVPHPAVVWFRNYIYIKPITHLFARVIIYSSPNSHSKTSKHIRSHTAITFPSPYHIHSLFLFKHNNMYKHLWSRYSLVFFVCIFCFTGLIFYRHTLTNRLDTATVSLLKYFILSRYLHITRSRVHIRQYGEYVCVRALKFFWISRIWF